MNEVASINFYLKFVVKVFICLSLGFGLTGKKHYCDLVGANHNAEDNLANHRPTQLMLRLSLTWLYSVLKLL